MPSSHGDFTRDPLISAFGLVLRGHRESSGLSRRQLAEALGCSPQWIEKIETGQKPPSEATAEDFDTYFKTPGGLFHAMWTEIKRAGKHLVLPPGFPGFVEREAVATEMQIFETMMVTGLFQTRDYAFEVLKSGRRLEEIEQLVATRLERQQILDRDHPPEIAAVFDENVIRRPIGGQTTMGDQIQQLIDLAGRPNIQLQIVPATTGAYAGLPGAFTLLGFDDGSRAYYVEGHSGGQFVDRPDKVREHALRFSLIRGAAMSADESLKLLYAIRESL
jgi:transcriptional regulator with XRE-family HTH domain